MVTGANGWLGRSAISVLSERYAGKYQIYAVTRNKQSLSNFTYRNLHVISYDEIQNIEIPITGLIHTAFKTQSYITGSNSEEYRGENLAILKWLENFIEKKRPKWAISVSSGAAAGYLEKKSKGLELSVKDIYGELKALEEEIFLKSPIQNVAIGRLWAASGRYMQNYRIYALGEFIEKALKFENILLMSKKPVFRCYVDAEDFIDVILNCALTNSRTLIDSGGVLTSIENLAVRVVEETALRTGRSVEIVIGNADISESNQNYFPKSNRFNLLMERYGILGLTLEQQIERTSIAVRERLDVAAQ